MEDLVTRPDPSFWRGKRVLLTGHTGFKGSWLATWLVRLGATVSGIALPPAGRPNLFELCGLERQIDSRCLDIRDEDALAAAVKDTDADIVLHLAAQALVSVGYRDPVGTFATNVMGTVNLLSALRHSPRTRSVVVVTTDKVYRTSDRPHRESDSLGASDPYSTSKAASELVVTSWQHSYFSSEQIGVATARAGNVIGGGDWAADRLIPDAVRAWQENQPLSLRRPDAIRPWQHVLEPLSGYLVLAQRIWQDPAMSGAYNFGPAPGDDVTVAALVQRAKSAFGSDAEITLRPTGMLETDRLQLDSEKAKAALGVAPLWLVDTAVERTMAWYREHARGVSAEHLCHRDIDAFEAAS